MSKKKTKKKARVLYAQDRAPKRDLRDILRGEVYNDGLTARDRENLMRFRDLAIDVPRAVEGMIRNERLSPMARVRVMEMVLDRAYGKAEANVNVNGTVAGVVASATRVEALVQRLKDRESDEDDEWGDSAAASGGDRERGRVCGFDGAARKMDP